MAHFDAKYLNERLLGGYNTKFSMGDNMVFWYLIHRQTAQFVAKS